MAAKMLVLTVKHTGHVLSATTVATQPVVPPTAADLVGDALTLWSIPGVIPSWSLALPADALDVAVIDVKDELLASPFDWTIGTDRQAAQLQHITDGPPTIALPAGPPQKITLTPPNLVPPFTADGIAAMVFERGATGPVQAYPGVTANGTADFLYTGAPAKTVLGVVREFPIAVALF
jgi:hypothetical protein